MRFQVIDWEVEDIAESDLPEDLIRKRVHTTKFGRSTLERFMYTVTMYGRAADGRSVAVRLLRFLPYFFIRLKDCPKLDANDNIRRIGDHVKLHLNGPIGDEYRRVSIQTQTEFFGFTGGTKQQFAKVTFDSLRAMRRSASALKCGPGSQIRLNGTSHKIVLYESRIEPLSRLIHAKHLPSAGWVRVDESSAEAGSWSTAEVCLTVDYNKGISADEDEDGLAPAVMSAFDIECTSCSGDFPVAAKTYRKLANNIKDVLAVASEHGCPRCDKRELVRATVLLTLGKDISSEATLDVVEWIGERSPATMTRRLLGVAETKAPVTDSDVLAAVDPLLDDLMNYGSNSVAYADKSMPHSSTDQMEEILGKALPPLKGDPVIQIGVTSNRVGDATCFRKWICALGTCESVAGAEVVPCETEADLLMAFAGHIRDVDPDMLTGYNIYGFDMKYIYERAREVGVDRAMMKALSRRTDAPARFVEKRLSSSALGDNVFWLITMPGRVVVDLMKVVMRDHKLESYKLDNVAFHFTGEKKRDVSPKDIFRLHAGDAADRAVVADYCVQDCELCNMLLEKLRVYINAVAMATTSRVPLSYIFLRGQGVKILSLVSYYCREREVLIRDLYQQPRELEPNAPDWKVKKHADEARECFPEPGDDLDVQGAIVLEPDTGFYEDDPVAVCDYASLYPSSILSHGLSPDARVIDDKYRATEGYDFVDVSFDLFEGDGNAKKAAGKEVVTFAIRKDANVEDPSTLAVIPAVQRILLTARANTRRKMKHKKAVFLDGRTVVGELRISDEAGTTVGGVSVIESELAEPLCDAYGEFMKAVLDGQQMSYKLLANSVYGQLGARTSDIRDLRVAACVTSVGRSLILSARDYIHESGGKVVYGDTDSVFFTLPVIDPITGERLTGKAALPGVIRGAIEIGKAFTASRLLAPHDLEYEKTFWPLLLLAKKKYVGNMYERDSNAYCLKSMGIVLKRRDNAPIVRKVMTALLDRLLNNLDVKGAIDNMLEVIDRVVDGRVPIEDLVITKTLKQEYKDKSRIAHAVLAQRVGERDPGNAPQANDRIPMVHIRVKQPASGKNLLQGDKVELPEHVVSQNLEVDYQYYLEDQIMNPTLQVLSAIVEQIPTYNKPAGFWQARHDSIQDKFRAVGGTEEILRKRTRETLDKERQAEAKRLVFDPKICRLRNKYDNQRELSSFGFFFKNKSARD